MQARTKGWETRGLTGAGERQSRVRATHCDRVATHHEHPIMSTHHEHRTAQATLLVARVSCSATSTTRLGVYEYTQCTLHKGSLAAHMSCTSRVETLRHAAAGLLARTRT